MILSRTDGVATKGERLGRPRRVGETCRRVIALEEPGKVPSLAGGGVRQDIRDFVGAVVLGNGRINVRQVKEIYGVVHRTDRRSVPWAGVGIPGDEECLGVETEDVLSGRHYGIEFPNRAAVAAEIFECLMSLDGYPRRRMPGYCGDRWVAHAVDVVGQRGRQVGYVNLMSRERSIVRPVFVSVKVSVTVPAPPGVVEGMAE